MIDINYSVFWFYHIGRVDVLKTYMCLYQCATLYWSQSDAEISDTLKPVCWYNVGLFIILLIMNSILCTGYTLFYKSCFNNWIAWYSNSTTLWCKIHFYFPFHFCLHSIFFLPIQKRNNKQKILILIQHVWIGNILKEIE